MRKIASLVLLVVAVTAAACTSSPTSSPDRGEMGPQFDGGVFGGLGNAAGTPPPATPSGNTTAAESEVTATDTTNSRSGVFGGSGN